MKSRQSKSNAANVIKFPEQRRRFLDVKIGETELRTLRQLAEYEGLRQIASDMDIGEMTLLRVCAGFSDRMHARTRQKVLAFFGKSIVE
jgi:hypothetical protein